MGSDGTMGVSTFISSPDGRGLPFTFDVDKTMAVPGKKKVIETQYAPNVCVQNAIAITADAK